MALSERVKFALVLSAGIVLPGLADYALAQAGYDLLGSFVWATGYFGTMILIWYVWLRPLDITGPS
ncbi:hypothetical protein [Halorientalis salina]|uniref:hypothetical protein n=1 Tax=Halorientalis salina TaxID=2932266 RepID=UPI0010AB7794|nr:hypothetical protein [Halorientalis salina]